MSNMEHTALEKTLSPTQVWALALGSIVGWGCFAASCCREFLKSGNFTRWQGGKFTRAK